MHQVVFMDVILDSIFENYRFQNSHGPSDLLKLRTVCKIWANRILYIDEQCWIRWLNPKTRLKLQPQLGPYWLYKQHKFKIKESMVDRITSIRLFRTNGSKELIKETTKRISQQKSIFHTIKYLESK